MAADAEQSRRSGAAPYPAGVFALTLAAACAPALTMRAQDVSIHPRQVAVMEANVEIAVLSDNRLQPREDWTRAAQTHLDTALQARARATGAKVVDPEAFDELEYLRFYRWAYRSLGQIAARIEGHAFPEVKSVVQWRYDQGLESWPSALGGADHVLVVWFRDAHQAADQIIGNLFSPVKVSGRQVGIACIVNLESRRMVWCERQVDGFGDLRTRASAKTAVDRLVRPILRR